MSIYSQSLMQKLADEIDPVTEIFKPRQEQPVTNTISEHGRDRSEFAHLPAMDTQKSWKYSLIQKGDKGKQLQVSANGRVFRWDLDEGFDPESDTPAILKRHSDASEPELGLGGKKLSHGVLQVHSSSPSRIYATMQDGRHNFTFNLSNAKGDEWVMVPKPRKKRPVVQDFLEGVQSMAKQHEAPVAPVVPEVAPAVEQVAKEAFLKGAMTIPNNLDPQKLKDLASRAEQSLSQGESSSDTQTPVLPFLGYPGARLKSIGYGAGVGSLLALAHSGFRRLMGDRGTPGILPSLAIGGVLGGGAGAAINAADMLMSGESPYKGLSPSEIYQLEMKKKMGLV
jgi:hypothetical protein